MRPVGIEFLTVLGLPPIEFVHLAADLGCPYISSGLHAMPMNPLGYPSSSLAEDAPLRRGMITAMEERGVAITLGEGFIVRPGADVRDRQRDLELMHELRVERINTISMDPDLPRTLSQFAALAEMAADADMMLTLEFAPGMSVADLPSALAALQQVGAPNFRLLIDTMHLVRSGGTAQDLSRVDPALIEYVQLSDVPLVPVIPNYMEEGMFERRPPGQGELPLAEILAALPANVIVSLEIPELSKARSGVSPRDRIGFCVEAARALLDGL